MPRNIVDSPGPELSARRVMQGVGGSLICLQ